MSSENGGNGNGFSENERKVIALEDVRRRLRQRATDAESQKFIHPMNAIDEMRTALTQELNKAEALLLSSIGEMRDSGISAEEFGEIGDLLGQARQKFDAAVIALDEGETILTNAVLKYLAALEKTRNK